MSYHASGLGYLATPYQKYPDGTFSAFIDACKLAGKLLKHEYKVFSPIAHTHCIALYEQIDPHDLSIWIPFDEAIMSHCDYLLVAHMTSWKKSKGIAAEVEFFAKHDKPIYDLDPHTLQTIRRQDWTIYHTFAFEIGTVGMKG